MSPVTDPFHDPMAKHRSAADGQGQMMLDDISLLGQLENLGWKTAPWQRSVMNFECWSGKGSQHGRIHVRIHDSGVALVMISLPGLKLTEEHELYSRFLDLSMETRLALTATELLTHRNDPQNSALLLWLTEGRVALYDLVQEIRMEQATTAEQLQDHLLPLLSAPAKLQSARAQNTQADPLSLKQWVVHWGMKLGAATGLEPEHAERFVWQWLILLQMQRYTAGVESMGQWGIQATTGETRLRLDFEALNAGDQLLGLLNSFESAVQTSLLLPVTDEEIETLQQIETDSLLDQFRAELLMIRRSRMEAESVAWMFTDLDREQEGWRLEVRGVDPLRKRLKTQGWMVFQPLNCDFARTGLTHILAELDRIADFVALQQEHERLRKGNDDVFTQPDLFMTRPEGVNEKGRLVDEINYILGNTLRISGIGPGEHFGVALTVLIKCFALARRHGWNPGAVTHLDHALGLKRSKS